MENVEESELCREENVTCVREARLHAHSCTARDSRGTVQLDSLRLEHSKQAAFFEAGWEGLGAVLSGRM